MPLSLLTDGVWDIKSTIVSNPDIVHATINPAREQYTNIIRNITYRFVGGTYEVTCLSIIDGGQIFAIASVALGGAAMISAFNIKKSNKKKWIGQKNSNRNGDNNNKINTITKLYHILLFYNK